MGMDPYIGEISIFAGSYAPQDWAYCQGQLMQIFENEALFVLLQTTYGGDGRSTYGLPDLRDRSVIGFGSADSNTGRSARTIGDQGGSEQVTLTTDQMPSHSHPAQSIVSGAISITSTLNGTGAAADSQSPTGLLANANARIYSSQSGSGSASFSPNAISNTVSNTLSVATSISNNGSDKAHNNMHPWLCSGYIISLAGAYPPRNI